MAVSKEKLQFEAENSEKMMIICDFIIIFQFFDVILTLI